MVSEISIDVLAPRRGDGGVRRWPAGRSAEVLKPGLPAW
jgi:hypothetical protein